MGYLFSTRRHRLVLPHRVMNALAPLVFELLELLDAVGAHLEDDRWRDAADRLRLALEELRRPSSEYDRTLRLEQREREATTRQALEQHLAELARATVNTEAMKRDREERKREKAELEHTRRRLIARRTRLEHELGRLPARRGSTPPRKGVAFVRSIATRLTR